jgi:hypothetical protein
VRLLGAVPAGASGGDARELVGLGVQGEAGMFHGGFELQIPIVGSPFTARVALSLGIHG